ncbi:MAG TPA: molybdopterin biosynthesis protein, partial [Anaerolineae bacterium]|nr:molybdopterin biosynthesis protein [Anaerolineae bacterium]
MFPGVLFLSEQTMDMKRHIYLEDIPLEEARAALQAALADADMWRPLGVETVLVAEANGRITAEAIWAKLSSPHYHASAMDGFAVRAKDTEAATETNPVHLTLWESWDELPEGMMVAHPVNTGHAMPPWANAVVMIEHTQ